MCLYTRFIEPQVSQTVSYTLICLSMSPVQKMFHVIQATTPVAGSLRYLIVLKGCFYYRESLG